MGFLDLTSTAVLCIGQYCKTIAQSGWESENVSVFSRVKWIRLVLECILYLILSLSMFEMSHGKKYI